MSKLRLVPLPVLSIKITKPGPLFSIACHLNALQ